MQFPEEWDHKQRSSTAVLNTNGTATNATIPRNTRTITSTELSSFASDVAHTHVRIEAQFLRSINSDIHSIAERVTSQLPFPPSEKMETAAGKKRPRETTAPEHTEHETKGSTAPRSDMRLELDTLLSRLPYKRLMQDMVCNALTRTKTDSIAA